MLDLISVLLLPVDLPHAVSSVALLALAYTAIVDARTGLVPPVPLAVAGMLILGALIAGESPRALAVPSHGLLVYAVIFGINEIHYRITGRDALGLGDAHWSLVATLLYGVPAVLFAWGAGAVLALLWLALRTFAGKPAGQVYFVPFLFIALILGKLMPLAA